MSSKMRHGDGEDCYLIKETGQTFESDPVVGILDFRPFDRMALQLITEDATENVPVETGDDADADTDTFAFAGFDFTGLEDATIRVEGSEDNDGDWVITVGGDGTATIDGSLTDEVFDPEAVTVTLIHTEAPLEGAWTIEVSNNYTPAGNGSYGQPPEQGTWTDITSSFEPTISAVTAASNQWAQADLGFRAIRVTFTPSGSAGEGDVTVIQYSKQVG